MSIDNLQRQIIIPPETQMFYDTYHYAPATRVGNMVWVSGQVGIDASLTPGTGIEEQAHLAFKALKHVLEAAGATLADVVELMTFHIDLQTDIQAFGVVKDEYFPNRYPSWTAVGTTQLAHPAFLVEVRAVAIVGCGQA